MIASYAQKHFSSACNRFFDAQIRNFFKEHFPGLLGDELLTMIASKLEQLIESLYPPLSRLKPGQMLWVAVDRHTRADSKKVRYKPVVLTLADQKEIRTLRHTNKSLPNLAPSAIARMCNEAYEQGTLLSMRDIALILKRSGSNVSNLVAAYEKEHKCELPTSATLQDMGSRTTHKAMIIRKLLIEKKDMAKVRNETKHCQRAIDRYLKAYRRVEMLLDEKKDIAYISQITLLSPFLIEQYRLLYYEIKSLKPSTS